MNILLKRTLNRGLAVLTLSLGLAWAAHVNVQRVEMVNASGGVVATGGLHNHLQVSGSLGAVCSLRVSTVTGGVATARIFVLASPLASRSPEPEHLMVRVNQQVISLETALERLGVASSGGRSQGGGSRSSGSRGGADDGPNHDDDDDRGGDRGRGGSDDSGGHSGGHR